MKFNWFNEHLDSKSEKRIDVAYRIHCYHSTCQYDTTYPRLQEPHTSKDRIGSSFLKPSPLMSKVSRGSHFKLPPSIFFTLSSMTVPMASPRFENTWLISIGHVIGGGFEGSEICSLGWKKIHQRLPNIFQYQSWYTSEKAVAVSIPFQKVDFNSIRPLGN